MRMSAPGGDEEAAAEDASVPREYHLSLGEFSPSGYHGCVSDCCRTRSDVARTRQHRELDWDAIYHLVMQLDLDERDKNMVLVRFRRVFLYVANNYSDVECYYSKSKLFVITVGIVNPSLLSITTSHDAVAYAILFWTVWTLQLLTSLVTAYINFNKWDKKYFLYMMHKHRIEQEMWTYLELTGRYSLVNPTHDEEVQLGRTTHRTKLSRFLLQIETIYRRLRDHDVDIESGDGDGDGDTVRGRGPTHGGSSLAATSTTGATSLAPPGGAAARPTLFAVQDNHEEALRQRIDDLRREMNALHTELAGSMSEEERGEQLRSLHQQMTQFTNIMRQNSWHQRENLLLRSASASAPVLPAPSHTPSAAQELTENDDRGSVRSAAPSLDSPIDPRASDD